jgi:hypothetical protein
MLGLLFSLVVVFVFGGGCGSKFKKWDFFGRNQNKIGLVMDARMKKGKRGTRVDAGFCGMV